MAQRTTPVSLKGSQRKLTGMRLLLIVLLCVLASQSQKQPAPDKHESKEHTSNPVTNHPPSNSVQNHSEPPANTGRTGENQTPSAPHQEEGRAQAIKEVNDSLLVVFTGALALFAWLQWKVLRKHEEWMQKHDANLAKLADASNRNAATAQTNVEIFISKERARLRVELNELKLPLDPSLPVHYVEYLVRYYGLTEARITNTGMASVITTQPEPTFEVDLSPIDIPTIVTSSTPLREHIQTFRVLALNGYVQTTKLTPKDLDDIEHKKLFVHCRGFIAYKDAFDQQRKTSFCYTWSVSDSALRNRIPGITLDKWERTGPPEFNEET